MMKQEDGIYNKVAAVVGSSMIRLMDSVKAERQEEVVFTRVVEGGANVVVRVKDSDVALATDYSEKDWNDSELSLSESNKKLKGNVKKFLWNAYAAGHDLTAKQLVKLEVESLPMPGSVAYESSYKEIENMVALENFMSFTGNGMFESNIDNTNDMPDAFGTVTV